jgi:GntR family transcriptional regulator
VNIGARQLLLETERERFLQEEWPRVMDMLHRLRLDPEHLLKGTLQKPEPESAQP